LLTYLLRDAGLREGMVRAWEQKVKRREGEKRWREDPPKNLGVAPSEQRGQPPWRKRPLEMTFKVIQGH